MPATVPWASPSASDTAVLRRWRPRGVTELLDAALDLYRASPLVVIAVVAAIVVPKTWLTAVVARLTGISGVAEGLAALVSPGQGAATNPTSAREALVALSVVDDLVLRPLLLGAVCVVVAARWSDKSTSVRRALAAAPRRLGALLVVGALTTLLHLPALVAQLSGSLTLPADPTPEQTADAAAAALGVGILQLAAFAASVPFAVAVPAVMVEGVGGGRALRRSWALLRGSYWRTLWTIVLADLVVTVVVAAFAGIAVVPELALGGDAARVLDAAVQALASVLALPVLLITIGLLYFDRRVRCEALDIEMLAATL